MHIADLTPRWLLLEEEFAPHRFLDRLEHVVRLSKRGATPGERQGAEHALQRMQARAEQEMPNMGDPDRAAFSQRMRRILGGNGTDRDDDAAMLHDLFRRFNDVYNPPPKPVTRWKVGQSVVHDEPGARTDGEIGRIFQIKVGIPIAYHMHWFSNDDGPAMEWVNEDKLRNLQVADVERIRARNQARQSSASA